MDVSGFFFSVGGDGKCQSVDLHQGGRGVDGRRPLTVSNPPCFTGGPGSGASCFFVRVLDGNAYEGGRVRFQRRTSPITDSGTTMTAPIRM